VDARGQGCLCRDPGVTGAGGDHRDRAPRRRQRADDRGPRHRVDVGIRQPLGDQRLCLLGEPGGEDGAIGVPGVQGAQDLDDLRGRLALSVDHLGITGTPRPVDVDPREAEIGGALAGPVVGVLAGAFTEVVLIVHAPRLSAASFPVGGPR